MQSLSGVLSTDTTNSALLVSFWNDSIRTICSINGGKWPFLEVEEEVQTVADQNFVTIPNNIRRVMSWRYTQGQDPDTDATWVPKMIFDSEAWERILSARLGTSSWPWFAYQKDRRLMLSPIPSVTGNLLSLRGRINIVDLSIADITPTIASVPLAVTLTAVVASGATSATLSSNWSLPTGLYTMFFSGGEQRVVTLTNGATTVTWTEELTEAATANTTVGTSTGGAIVTANATPFTLDMVGRYIRITQTSAANGGDGAWYKIGNYYSTSVIGLTTPYQGTAISGGTAASTLGQASPIPEAYAMAPIFRALWLYWEFKENTTLAQSYARKYDGGNEAGLSQTYGGILGQMMEEANQSQEGPYMAPLPRDGYGNGGNTGEPFYWPFQQASGL